MLRSTDRRRRVSEIDAEPGCTSHAALLAAAKQAVEAHDAQAAALAGESVDEAIEAAKHLTAAVARLRALVDGTYGGGGGRSQRAERERLPWGCRADEADRDREGLSRS